MLIVVELVWFLVYTLINNSGRGVFIMADVKVKPIQPTVVSDIDIIRDIIREATTKPSPAAIERNKEASELLHRLQGKPGKNEA